MTKESYFKRRTSSIGRGGRLVNTRDVRKTIWLLVEGEKTEKIYFGAIKKMADLTATEVRVVDCKNETSATQIVSKGIEFLHQEFPRIDEVWCIFDKEEKRYERNFKCAMEMAAGDLPSGKRLSCAVSNPCFEFWILLHYERTDRPFSNCREVVAPIKKHCPHYTKTKKAEIEKICLRFRSAVHNAEWLRSRDVVCPSTDVDVLLKALLKEDFLK